MFMKHILNYCFKRIMPRDLFQREPLTKRIKLNCNNIDSKPFTSSSKMPSTLICDKPKNNATSKSSENSNDIVKEVKYLETPTKSESDKKQYRVIQLENGLTALLIADVDRCANTNSTDDQKALLSHDDEESSAASSAADSDDESDSDDEILSENGGNDEENSDDEINLKKMKKKILSSNKEVKMAACGLCVGVGSFSDPPEVPGLAHFLEHMVFMGSEKYPKENDFDSFIQKCGGHDNASTEPEHTIFYFEVVEKHFFDALDRFAQFFISPLMLRDAISREREAVESEFQMALPSDSSRKEQLFCSLAQSGYPATKFTWGNLKTLRDNITEDELYKSLHDFRVRHYSAHRMTLTVQAKLSLDTLEEYVKKCFSSIPSNNLPGDNFSNYVGTKSFDTTSFRRIYKIKPIKDVCQVEMTWVMPPLHHLYKVKPHQYLSWIIGHEGKGSLINYLRKKMWCLEILCGNSESGFEHSSMYALFSLSLFLTNEGYKHLKEILDAVYSYINMLQKLGPQKRIYDEIQTIENINFKFIDDVPPFGYVQYLCEKMHFYAPSDYITGSDLYFEYDPEAIKNCMSFLTPENMNILIFNKQFNDDMLTKTETWFNTKYIDEDIPKEWINCWKEIKPYPEFHLPEVNLYLTDDFTLIPLNETYQYPKKIYQDNLYEIWYKPDAKFRLPECYMYFQLISPLMTTSPDGAAMGDLMVMILNQLLMEELYPATAAKLKFGLHTNRQGVVMEISGFNQKLPLLFKTSMSYIANSSELISEDLFQIFKSELLKEYYNTTLKRYKLEKQIRLSILMLTKWTATEKYDAINSISFNEFKHFMKYFSNHLYIKSLVQGNMSQDDVIKNTLDVFSQLNCGPLLPNTMPQTRFLSLPSESTCCRLKNFNQMDSNSLVLNYYQINLKSISLYVMIELLAMIMEEPLFNQLRTQQQLGYDVYCLIRDTYGLLGYSITVCTQADKFTTDDIDNRIENFLISFDDQLNTMSNEEFDNVKKSLIKIKQCSDIFLKEEVMRNWNEIVSGELVFDRHPREIDEINRIDIQQLRDCFRAFILNKGNSKKLSIQIVGSKKQQCSDQVNKNENNIDAEIISDAENHHNKLVIEFLDKSENSLNDLRPYNEYIKDIEKFKNKLFAYPVYNADQ
ncbi:nardilysin-like [Chelonus insularis]|uniref:nardilysin-like n=1 Tax=Chelonus insularis TaxID=460826 RepID=UPI00158A5A26|nr:nardilysin-like [Chelonus insularis]